MKAIITGINGQDGSYLAEFLVNKGYSIIGIYRRSSSPDFSRLKNVIDKITLVEGDVCDYGFLMNIIAKEWPDEIYNLAAQSHVKTSFEQPSYTGMVDYLGCLNILEVLRFLNNNTELTERYKLPKFYQASTSEMFGDSYDIKSEFWYWDFHRREYSPSVNGYKYQNEKTRFNPQSPYAIAKLAAHHAVRLYRESYGIYACSGILFNHESPRRGDLFVTKKITNYVRNLQYGFIDKLKLGNLDASRDWGFAGDYVEGMWLILQQEKPEDFVLGTGKTYTVRDFLNEAFLAIGIYDWTPYVMIDENFKRPAEVNYLRADATKAKEVLGWVPKTDFKGLVRMMINE